MSDRKTSSKGDSTVKRDSKPGGKAPGKQASQSSPHPKKGK